MGKPTKTTVVISRYWNRPEITVKVSDDGIAIEMDINEFMKAMASECSHPLSFVTRSRMERNFLKTLPAVLEKIKQASSSAV